LAFNTVQANAIAAVLSDAHTVPTQLSGIVLALLAAPAFFGGMRDSEMVKILWNEYNRRHGK
jgi:AGCS family alanine or glycine:cation symporter